MPIPPHVLEELLAAPPADFVRTRRRLAGQLRQQGEPYAAAELEAVKKPTAVVWAVNQIARRNAASLEHAAKSAARLRDLQLGRAAADGDRLRAAAAAYRQGVEALVGEAVGALRADGGSASRAIEQRIRATLHGAIVEESAWEGLRHGRLTSEREMAGFGAFPGLAAAPAPAEERRRGGRPVGGASVTRLDEARRRARGAGGAEANPPARATEPDAEARRREAERTRHEAAVREADRRLEAARVRARELARDLERAQREIEAAERESTRLGRSGSPGAPRR